MKKYLILLLFSTFAIGQTTIVNKLKINSAVKNNTDTRVLVQDSITKEVHWVLKASLGSVPSWNSTLSVNSTAQQNVTVNDPYNLYLRSGHLKLWHNIDANYADISIGSGYWKFNNSQFQDFEITPQGFSTYKYGGFTGSFNNSSLTANHSYRIPNVDGTLLTTAGTEVGSPITGAIEMTEGFNNLWIGAPDYPNDKNSLLFSQGGISLDYTNVVTGYNCSFIAGNGGLTVYDNNPASKGINSSVDYSANITDLDYTQKIYVNGLRGKFISKTTTEINAISTPQNGETYFNTTLSTLCFYDGTSWKRVSHSAM